MKNKGFSLLELSIVLVIIGLLASGVMVGQSLVKAAEIRSVMADMDKLQTAIYTFREKYMAIPGDMRNATAFWGFAAGTTGNDAACQNTYSTNARTCNGNGDGRIEHNAVNWGERFRALQHLANAGLLEGSYTGRDGSATPGDPLDANFTIADVNVPSCKKAGCLLRLENKPTTVGDVNWYDSPSFNYIIAGTASAVANTFKPEEAWKIDTKLDDGKPGTGIVFVNKPGGTWAPLCATTDVSATAAYNLTHTSEACEVILALR
ncbi:MAG: prepilin-type N-terminal cleavage/methylation domain-containing protein [Rickettsiales bacterium]|nr:prepilin-type N-terminal cleavage/methylation domain-containing protein [Rickettsiales bacterium]